MDEENFFHDIYIELKLYRIPDIDGFSDVSEKQIKDMFYDTILADQYKNRMYKIIRGGLTELKKEFLRIYVTGALELNLIDKELYDRINKRYNFEL